MWFVPNSQCMANHCLQCTCTCTYMYPPLFCFHSIKGFSLNWKKIMMPYMYINWCPSYFHLFIRSMQTYIKTWWTLKFSLHTTIFDDLNWSHLFWVFLFSRQTRKYDFPWKLYSVRNKHLQWLQCSLILCVWLYSKQLSLFYPKYFLWHFKNYHGNLQKNKNN